MAAQETGRPVKFIEDVYTAEPSIPEELASKSKLSPQFQARTPEENSKTNDNDIPEPQPPPTTPTKTRSVTPPSSIVTPRAVRSGLAKSPEATTPRRQHALETEGSTLVNGRTSKTPSPDAINDRNTSKDRSPRSPISPRPPSSLRVKSAGDKSTPSTPRTSPLTPSKTSPGTPRKTPSPKELRLPKLAPSPIPQETSPATPETHVKISLPKLIEPSSQATRMAY
nr:PREDICTED: proteoglycan 4-like [Linepithema humile]